MFTSVTRNHVNHLPLPAFPRDTWAMMSFVRFCISAPISVKPEGGGGGGVGHRVGILTFSKKNYQIPTPGRKRIVKVSSKNSLLLFYYIKLKDQMHDVGSKSPPWGYTPQSNSHGLPPSPSGLTLIGALPRKFTSGKYW